MITKEAFRHYTLNIKLVDDEHWEILEAIIELSHSSTNTESDIPQIDKIVNLWVTHAAKEEMMMEKTNFPYTEWHKREHEAVLRRFEDVRRKVTQHSYVDKKFISSDLQRIVCMHIDAYDRQFSEFMHK